jgi:FlaA1/EpsC-like NDP-sugar epimerase
VIACQLISFFVAGVYRGMWHYFTSADAVTYVKAVGLAVVSSILALLYLYRFTGYSRSVFLIDGMALLLLLMGSRYTFRLVSDLGVRGRPGRYRVLVYGAGEAGALLAREVRHNPRYDYQVIGFVDDDASKAGKRLAGLPVFGGLDDLAAVISREAPDFVVVSTTKIEADRLTGLSRLCYESGTGLLQFEFALKPLAVAATPGDPWSGGRNAATS